jgi:hypothetical protein
VLAAAPMRILKLLAVVLIQLVKDIWLLPRSVIALSRQRRDRNSQNERETERLDRIRNPSKYRGR